MDFFFVNLKKRFRIFGRTLLALDSGPDPFDPPGLLVPDVDVAVDEKSVVLDVATLVRETLVDLAAELEQLLATGPDLPGALLGDVELRLELRPEGCDPVAGAAVVATDQFRAPQDLLLVVVVLKRNWKIRS